MSENIQSSAKENTSSDSDEQVRSEKIWSVEEISSNLAYDKQQFLIEKANITFQELYKTLESEQTKLSELETRRINLQEEMLRLKTEIEEEKKSLNINIVRSVTENLNALNNASSINSSNVSHQSQTVSESLKSCCEEEEHKLLTTRYFPARDSKEIPKDEGTIEEQV